MDKELDVYYNGEDMVIAYSEEDAITVWDETIGTEHDHELYPWTKMPRGSKFCLVVTEDSELPKYLPDGAEVSTDTEYDYLVNATFGSWADSQGRGLLAVGEY